MFSKQLLLSYCNCILRLVFYIILTLIKHVLIVLVPISLKLFIKDFSK